ncbi:MAG: potassium-transporting ATPase subunit F [Candidatus Eremiobacteraeota bacterium]|nr:potassium-transporting ATPase subunit F [Candidatus Eremiobacteraeota bacterium]MBV8365200.1 potassium-transporting ATPase subunit F [Candidatus Eremiobacteraeota bacterium]
MVAGVPRCYDAYGISEATRRYYARYHPARFDAGHLLRVRSLHGRIGTALAMADQIIGLVLSLLALCYLTYAMLRPEKF